ncbi:bifunctional adenosylcobinamide kinase/adenosylcobinamide-phosphate guanylyltransferase [Chengkuizengella axinellae]|uniref:Adenosylcobinamide kinase n=1 Tax=Chengkuizengella axinellae TaxID=3064388 RepID=A0ABT9J0T4_9BACL|nr:bifunctional adenosylcobinamide kinase/adenosylcobinamide-phosphate guanylyltransferase [Chengkuizengella sp. 2205SS18-9]MDP5275212.1 bifunctional adenosylcobinamide kinase/adenosylcobinamide-phosphate guanylyltransferase [Chengkuizengella sp. 2205SS18-9]
MKILVTGGARSGKSSFAEKYATTFAGRGIYIATSEVHDQEMRDRVDLHQLKRGQYAFSWQTIEEPYDVNECIDSIDEDFGTNVILIDCLTLWLSNWLLRVEYDQNTVMTSLEGENGEKESYSEVQKKVIAKIEQLVASLKRFDGTILLVTNEVGNGIVPEYPLGRIYRDLSGIMNQKIAEVCDQVFLVTAGIPVELKSKQFCFKEG